MDTTDGRKERGLAMASVMKLKPHKAGLSWREAV